MAETIFKFKCPKKNFFPVKLMGNDCYKNLPVIQIDEKNQPMSSQTVYYLEPRSRILQPLGLEYKCDPNFQSFFQLNNKNWVTYLSNGISTNTEKFDPINMNTSIRIYETNREDFSMKSLYSFDQISNYNDLIMSSTKKATLEKFVADHINTKIASQPGKKPFYSYFTDISIFTASMDETFRRFGSYCGGIFSIIAIFIFMYNSIICLMGIRDFNQLEKTDKVHFLFRPTNYLLNRDRSSVILTEDQRKKLELLIK